MTATCTCRARWEGANIAHCGACHLTFTAVANFDAHRDAKTGTCRTEPNPRGQWRKPLPAGATPWGGAT